MIYIVSLSKKSAVKYEGNPHAMSIRSAVKKFADDAIAIGYCGSGSIGADVLNFRSTGEIHLSATELELISAAGK